MTGSSKRWWADMRPSMFSLFLTSVLPSVFILCAAHFLMNVYDRLVPGGAVDAVALLLAGFGTILSLWAVFAVVQALASRRVLKLLLLTEWRDCPFEEAEASFALRTVRRAFVDGSFMLVPLSAYVFLVGGMVAAIPLAAMAVLFVSSMLFLALLNGMRPDMMLRPDETGGFRRAPPLVAVNVIMMLADVAFLTALLWALGIRRLMDGQLSLGGVLAVCLVSAAALTLFDSIQRQYQVRILRKQIDEPLSPDVFQL